MKTQRVYLNSSEFQPKNEYVLVKPENFKSEEIRESGIVIPLSQTSTDRPTSGIVQAVGKDIDDITEDTFVMWPNTDGLDIEFEDGVFILLRYKSIIGSKKA